MRRREFIAGLGGAVAWPMVARAQPGECVRRIAHVLQGASMLSCAKLLCGRVIWSTPARNV
jgi:hypothetical protein